MNFLLKLFDTKKLWLEILRREGYFGTEGAEHGMIWQQVFSKVPEVRDYLKRREISLLRGQSLKEGKKSEDFYLGQIYENRLWQRYDIPNVAPLGKVETAAKQKRFNLEDILGKWQGEPAQTNGEENR